jgi:hypothetical protein
MSFMARLRDFGADSLKLSHRDVHFLIDSRVAVR